ncbi:hypothetical protein SCHPADRAFT_483486 [Schizopora paradoxa]|uniref:Zn(2)-C6 fungal-type domain-containing protein n=1 Tax=Schizopora paradoxa TaxID=27342 RepID=A0A0H2RH21_9AGAM|nr:hypothetical protein SCHPADRAFT_483486 [Schizopora paradoxa]
MPRVGPPHYLKQRHLKESRRTSLLLPPLTSLAPSLHTLPSDPMQRAPKEKNVNRSAAARNRCQQCCDHCRQNHRKCDGGDPCASCVRSRVQCTRLGRSGNEETRRQTRESGAFEGDVVTRRDGQHFFVKHGDGYLVVFAKGDDCYVACTNEHYDVVSPHHKIGSKHRALEISRNFTVDELVNAESSHIDALFVKREPLMDCPSPASDCTISSASSSSSPLLMPSLIDYAQKRQYSGSAVYRGGYRHPG